MNLPGTTHALIAGMLTFDDVKRLVDDLWPVAHSGSTAVLLRLQLDGRIQKVLIENGDKRALPAIVVIAEIGPTRLIDAMDALRYNGTAEHGTLAIIRGVYALRQVLPLEGLTGEQIHVAIRTASVEATRFARAASAPALPAAVWSSVFAHIEE